MDLETRIARAMAQDRPRGEMMTGFLSKHSRGDFNENNTGLGYKTPEGWMIGAYQNSINKPSVYAGKEWLGNLFGNVDAGAMAGLVSGYGGIRPAVLPQLVYRMPDDRSVAATVVPPVGKIPTTFAVQLRKKF